MIEPTFRDHRDSVRVLITHIEVRSMKSVNVNLRLLALLRFWLALVFNGMVDIKKEKSKKQLWHTSDRLYCTNKTQTSAV